MVQKGLIKKETIVLESSYLRQDLRRLLLLIGLLILAVVVLAIIDKQTGFLAKLASLLMIILVGK